MGLTTLPRKLTPSKAVNGHMPLNTGFRWKCTVFLGIAAGLLGNNPSGLYAHYRPTDKAK